MSDFFIGLYKMIFAFFNDIISILFGPIDLLLQGVIPNYENMSTYIDNFFNFIGDYVYFILSWMNIPPIAIDLILGYITFRVVLFFGTMSFKLFVRWFSALRS